MLSTYCHHILDFNSLKHTSYQSLSNPTILSWDMFCMFSEGGKKCSRLHETNPQDDHNKEKGLVLLTLFWGNKYISTEGKAYVTPYLFSLGYYPLRSSQNPIPITGFKHLDRWPGNFQNSKILKWSLFFLHWNDLLCHIKHLSGPLGFWSYHCFKQIKCNCH